MTTRPYDAVLAFWFGEPGEDPKKKSALWWKKDPELDKQIREQFGVDQQRALRGELDSWKQEPEGLLAFVVLLDQFSRNMHRNTPAAFGGDALALAAAIEAQDRGLDLQLDPTRRTFVYMPMMHSEDLACQERGIKAFEQLAADAPEALKEGLEGNVKFAKMHRDIVARFGRFPHRNAILGRETTEEEAEFLKQPGSSF